MIGITQIAAGTTIAVNVLTIRETIHKAKTASKAVISGSKKAGKKVKKVVTGS